MLGADGQLWVVKFQNNPQHLRVLANEFLATRLAEAMGLPVPATEVIEVTEWLVTHTQALFVQPVSGGRVRCTPGLQFGARYVGGERSGQVFDYLPEEQLCSVRNLDTFAGVLVLDKWTGNCNGRQAVFAKQPRERRYRATFIDQGYCFNVAAWNFPDSPKRGVYGADCVYAGVTGWESFEPWLRRMETLAAEQIWEIAEEIPPEWYNGDSSGLEQLVEALLYRRQRVPKLIEEFRLCDRTPFPNWRARVSVPERITP